MYVFIAQIFALLFMTFPSHAAMLCESYELPAAICKPLTSIQETKVELCKAEMKAANCDQWFSENPTAILKARNCERLATCPLPTKISDLAVACLSAGYDSAVDIGVGVIQFVAGVSMSVDLKAREQFFENCRTAQCKRDMLGPYADLFTKKEIEGVWDVKGDGSGNLEGQNQASGLSAKVLYRKLLEKLRQRAKNKSIHEKFIQPWSGQPAAPAHSMDELITQTLAKAGVHKPVCYDPAIVAEMWCYAAGLVLNPIIAVKVLPKIAELAGLSKAAKEQKLFALKSNETVKTDNNSINDVLYDEATVSEFELKPRDPEFNPEIEIAKQGYNESPKYRTLYVDKETRAKFKALSENPNISDADLPKEFFNVYKESRLKGLSPAARSKVEEALKNTKVVEPDGTSVGSYYSKNNSIELNYDPEMVESLRYYKTYVHEIEHSIQNTSNSKVRSFLRTLSYRNFSPEPKFRYHHRQELGAMKAEYDFLKNMPAAAVDRMTMDMTKKGFGVDAAYLRLQWAEAEKGFESYRTTASYSDMKAIKDAYPDKVGNFARMRNVMAVVILNGDYLSGGKVSKPVVESYKKALKTTCTRVLKLSAEKCDF